MSQHHDRSTHGQTCFFSTSNHFILTTGTPGTGTRVPGTGTRYRCHGPTGMSVTHTVHCLYTGTYKVLRIIPTSGPLVKKPPVVPGSRTILPGTPSYLEPLWLVCMCMYGTHIMSFSCFIQRRSVHDDIIPSSLVHYSATTNAPHLFCVCVCSPSAIYQILPQPSLFHILFLS